MVDSVNGVELDWKAREVFEAIAECGGEASTTEVKEYTGFERNEVVKYRFGMLAEAGLVTTRQPSSDTGRPAAKVASLTEAAEDLVADEDFELGVGVGDESMTMDERMLRLEKQVGRMRDTYGEVKQRIVGLEETLEEYDGDLDEIDGKVEALRDAFERDGIVVEEEFEFSDD